jgi:DnaK suppressor protein
MNTQIAEKYKILFEQQRNKLLYSTVLLDENFHLQKEDMIDETDMTSCEMEQAMRIRLRNREALFLKKIDEALSRISEGTFGDCVSCSEEIDPKRLEARPTATHCVHCKEEAERREHVHIDGHQSKSLGRRLRMA